MSQPLMPEADAPKVWVVYSVEKDPLIVDIEGVYPSPERAFAYITDWLKQASDDPDEFDTEYLQLFDTEDLQLLKIDNSSYEVTDYSGYLLYTIQQTHSRP